MIGVVVYGAMHPILLRAKGLSLHAGFGLAVVSVVAGLVNTLFYCLARARGDVEWEEFIAIQKTIQTDVYTAYGVNKITSKILCIFTRFTLGDMLTWMAYIRSSLSFEMFIHKPIFKEFLNHFDILEFEDIKFV